MMRTAAHKLIYRPMGVSELYDMKADGRELNNVYGQAEYADIQRDLERRLLDWWVGSSDVTPFDEDSRW